MINITPWLTANQEAIMSYYLKTPITQRLIRSPFREDHTPTCGFYYGKSKKLYLHDFATDEHFDTIEIVKRLNSCNYKKAIEIILSDEENFKSVKENRSGGFSGDSLLDFVPDSSPHEYFSRFGIRNSTLGRFGVQRAKALYINEDLLWRGTDKNPIFIYSHPSGRIKAYRPLSKDKTKKWKSSTRIEDVHGGAILQVRGTSRKRSILFITSSLKDVMVLYELGYPAIAFSSEAIPTKGETGKFVKDYINRLKEKFEHIILFLDNDEPGIKLSQKASRAFSLPYVTTPEKEPKDISDYLLKHGKRKTHRTVKQLIKKYLKNEQTTDAKLASEFDSFVSDSSLHSISLDALFGEQPNGENADAANPT